MPAGAGLRRRFVLLTALRWLPVGFVTPVAVLLPLSRGLSLGQVGLVMACYAATTALLELPTGGVADAVGRRAVLVASSAVGIVVFALMLVADGLAPWIAVKVMAGAARALDSGPLEAWYVDEARRLDPAADIRRGLSRAHAAEAGGLGLSAAAGGVLPVAFGGSLTAAVVAAGAAQGLHLVGVLALVTEHRRPDPRALRRAARQVPAVMGGGLAVATGRGPVSWLLCGSVVWGLALGGIELLWQPRFTDLLGGRSDTGPLGVLMAVAFLAAAVGSALVRRLARLVGGGAGRPGRRGRAAARRSRLTDAPVVPWHAGGGLHARTSRPALRSAPARRSRAQRHEPVLCRFAKLVERPPGLGRRCRIGARQAAGLELVLVEDERRSCASPWRVWPAGR